ncbi:MAG: cysteine synthase family protein [Planctomycetota bacterium]
MKANLKYQSLFQQYPALSMIGNTPLYSVRLFSEELPKFSLFAKAEWVNPGGSIKDRPALRIILEGILSGELTRDKMLLDSSSGNAGISYSMIGAMMGYRVKLVMPGNVSAERKFRIKAHGSEIFLTDPIEGYDEALRTCHRMYEENPELYFFADQYSNDNNWKAHYETTAEEIWTQTQGKITHFVAGIGTGGTITGVGRRLKEYNPKIKITCVIPEAFPGIEGLKPIENPEDIRPAILDESVIDERIKISIEEAYEYCHRLAKRGIFVGQSSGAFIKGAHEVGQREKQGVCVTILCDIGERYCSTPLWR